MNSKSNGFTLIELLVVVLIIGVLAAIAVPQYQKAVLKSRFSSLMPSTRAVRDGNELYYMTQNRYATNVSDLDVKVASNDESTIQVKNDGDYIYTIATAPKLKNNLVMYQKHSGKFAGEIHCEADKDDAQAIWLCSEGLHGVEKDGSLTPNYKTYILEGTGTDSFGAAGKMFISAITSAGQCNNDTVCEEMFAWDGRIMLQDNTGEKELIFAGPGGFGVWFYNPNTGELSLSRDIGDSEPGVSFLSYSSQYDPSRSLDENMGDLWDQSTEVFNTMANTAVVAVWDENKSNEENIDNVWDYLAMHPTENAAVYLGTFAQIYAQEHDYLQTVANAGNTEIQYWLETIDNLDY